MLKMEIMRTKGMKNFKFYLVICLSLLILFTGCKFILENAKEKVLEVCNTFDTAIRISNSDVAVAETILTSDFIYDDECGYIYPRSEFIVIIESTGAGIEDKYDADISNINVSGTNATAELDYSYANEKIDCELTLKDEGNLFSYDWKISKFDIVSYIDSSSCRLHGFSK